ncbi:hypothetical protein CAMGR0001_2289 [Campylobacter gracilis RM3268]|uniref:Uncharacterized protein n=1 Tax=Campylobacter gracilis RM3268 TaxID=553220 RepID=C8PH95_9BACT|nr:hypothetical protein CAMGR0001_2289 [Campylobacter gracilis RM3268]
MIIINKWLNFIKFIYKMRILNFIIRYSRLLRKHNEKLEY